MNKLQALKLITNTQIDLTYINMLITKTFADPAKYAHIQANVQLINNLGSHLFGCAGNSDVHIQKTWYLALTNVITESIKDTNNLIAQISTQNQTTNDLIIVLNELIEDCQLIQTNVIDQCIAQSSAN